MSTSATLTGNAPRTRSTHGGGFKSLVSAVLDAVSFGRSAHIEWRRSVARGDDPAEAVKRIFGC